MKDKFNFNIDNAFAAAVIAQNINKRYIKVTQEPPGVSANRTLVMSMLTDVIPFTDSEMEAGRKIRQYFQQHLTFKIVKGVEISPFERVATEISNKETATCNYDISIIASLPSVYERAMQRKDADTKINFARGGNIGAIKDRVTLSVEVLKCIYSQNYGVYFITAITPEDQVVFFSYAARIEIGSKVTVKGTVKKHTVDSTQLNRVKFV